VQRVNTTKQAVMSWAMLTSIALFACACTEQEANRSSQEGSALYYETLTLRYQPNPKHLDLVQLAEDLGYLAPIQLRNIGAPNSEAHIIESVLAKHSDFGSAFNGTLALSRANGNPVKALIGAFISAEQNGISCFVSDDGPVHSASDLIGKKIAINGSSDQNVLIVKNYLYRNGLDKKSVDSIEFVEMPLTEVEPLLRSGQIDAALSRTGIRNRDGLRILFSAVDANGPYVAGSYFFTENFIETHPNTVDKFVDAIAQTIEWLRHSPRKVVAERLENLNSMARSNQSIDHETINAFSQGGLLRNHDFQRWIDLFIIDKQPHSNEIEAKSIYDNRYNPYWYGNPNLKRKAQSIL